MSYVLIGVLGLAALGAVIWLNHRVRLRLGRARRDRLRTSEQAQREAELQMRHNLPFR